MKAHSGDREGGISLNETSAEGVSVLLSTAAGNSCLLHLPEVFVSLVV